MNYRSLLEQRGGSRRNYKENDRELQKYLVKKVIKLKGFLKVFSLYFQRNREEAPSSLWELEDPNR